MGSATSKVDTSKNRIYLKFQGFMTLEEAKELRDEYRRAIEQCTHGFTVLTDAVDYKPGKTEIQEVVASMTKMAGEAGCGKVARVVGDRPLGGMQIDRHSKEQATYPSRHFETMEEAEAYLDSDLDS